ncbi:hypothetical protein [Sinorhizobium psoraleae]|uniref:Uncharacterized protein n=1 Tax=Sinorhizobium psoraleae TaxID=520838 RepID=A0ABT4KP27_9HYPH|nr:hypothetical protein [Sinorhizobium psoraleae]MCZ4093739.1 hypothetical protein [Sinorhizobium psoraleae]
MAETEAWNHQRLNHYRHGAGRPTAPMSMKSNSSSLMPSMETSFGRWLPRLVHPNEAADVVVADEDQ